MTTVITEPCLVDDMPDDVYHADPVEGGSLSVSRTKVLIEPGGPALFKYRQTQPRTSNPVFDFGHAAHQTVLGRGAPIVVIPDDVLSINGAATTKAAKEFIKDAHDKGQIPLKPADYRQVQDMADALTNHTAAMSLLTHPDGRPEVSAFRYDPKFLTWVRARFDMLLPDGIVDYKTAQTADPVVFQARQMPRYGYHLQAAWYLDMAIGLGAILEDEASFWFVVQEKTAPYRVSVIRMSDEYIEVGREANTLALEKYWRCMVDDEWPAWPDVHDAIPPQWISETLIDDETEADDVF